MLTVHCLKFELVGKLMTYAQVRSQDFSGGGGITEPEASSNWKLNLTERGLSSLFILEAFPSLATGLPAYPLKIKIMITYL